MVAMSGAYSLKERDLLFAVGEPQYVLRFKDMPDDERPRERMIATGPTNLSLAELIAIIWGSGNRKEDVMAMARRTLKEYGDKTIAHEQNPERLSEAAGISLT